MKRGVGGPSGTVGYSKARGREGWVSWVTVAMLVVSGIPSHGHNGNSIFNLDLCFELWAPIYLLEQST